MVWNSLPNEVRLVESYPHCLIYVCPLLLDLCLSLLCFACYVVLCLILLTLLVAFARHTIYGTLLFRFFAPIPLNQGLSSSRYAERLVSSLHAK